MTARNEVRRRGCGSSTADFLQDFNQAATPAGWYKYNTRRPGMPEPRSTGAAQCVRIT